MLEAIGGGALIAAESGPELPSINDFLPPEILFQGTPFAMNRIILVRVVATVILLLVLGITAARAKLIPSRWQGAVEWVIEFVRDSIVYDTLGEERGRRYVPMIATIFFSVLVFNLCGVIPGMNIAATATVTMPLFFAIWSFFGYMSAGIREQGWVGYFKSELFPAGVPWPLYIILTPIQLFEMIIVKPASLTIRLFANMIAGHLLVAVTLAFTQFYIFEAANKLMAVAGVAWFALGFTLTCFEIFVAALQAYIFAILTTVYIGMSYPEED
ncbi:F0F1 ATP synthase subunit A [Bifidobacterium favimelis]|uniref:ATP synthase subunit a n=1 Tax=Bifidobacterium favimelis TaxID=3122979 RepID=A0ABU8ZLF3_9BIFI